jgi:hypothetical protein
MTALPIHEITLSAGSRSFTLFFVAFPTPAQLLAALSQDETFDPEAPHFRALVERVKKGEYAAVARVMWANPVFSGVPNAQ